MKSRKGGEEKVVLEGMGILGCRNRVIFVFLLMNRKLELRKYTGIRGTESLVWMIYSIGLWILNQRQMSTVVTVFYALVLHFVITCVFTKAPLFLQFFMLYCIRPMRYLQM